MSSSKKLFKIYTKDNPNGLGGNVFAYVMQSKKFTHMENDSIVYNQNDLQIVGGIMYADLGSEQKARDNSEVLSYESVSINDVVIDYSGRNTMGSVEVNYTIDEKSSVGLNTQINWDKIQHEVDLKEVAHYTQGVEDFKSRGINESNNKPLKWLTNAYFNTRLGRSSLELTNGEFYKFTVLKKKYRVNFSVLFDLFRQLAVCHSVTVLALLPLFVQQFTRNKIKNSAK